MRPNVICTKINSCQSARTCPSVAQEHPECGILILVAYIIIAVMNSISITAGRMITFVISMPSIQWQNIASELVSE